MSWVILVLSGVLEAVWATALGKSENFSRAVPSVVFLVALALSMAGLAYAMRELPVGTSYAVWVGIGALLTVGLRHGYGRRGGVTAEDPVPARDHRVGNRPQARALTPFESVGVTQR